MKRFFSILTVVAILASMSCIPAFAEDADSADVWPCEQYIIMDEEIADLMANESSGVSGSVSEEGYLHLTVEAGNNDPQYNVSFADGGADEVECESYPVCAIRLRLLTAGEYGSGEAFLETTSIAGASAGYSRTFAYKYTIGDEWQTIIIDGSKNKTFRENAEDGDCWVGLRWDVFGSTVNATEPIEIDVAWIAFFKTADAAKAFDGDFSAIPTPTPTPEPTATPVPTPTPEPTATPTEAPTAEPTAEATSSGCGSVIAGSTVAVIACAAFVLKKKRH